MLRETAVSAGGFFTPRPESGPSPLSLAAVEQARASWCLVEHELLNAGFDVESRAQARELLRAHIRRLSSIEGGLR